MDAQATGVVESLRALEFVVARASVREAINLLVSEGFVEKTVGRSARVTKHMADDAARIYEVRGPAWRRALSTGSAGKE